MLAAPVVGVPDGAMDWALADVHSLADLGGLLVIDHGAVAPTTVGLRGFRAESIGMRPLRAAVPQPTFDSMPYRNAKEQAREARACTGDAVAQVVQNVLGLDSQHDLTRGVILKLSMDFEPDLHGVQRSHGCITDWARNFQDLLSIQPPNLGRVVRGEIDAADLEPRWDPWEYVEDPPFVKGASSGCGLRGAKADLHRPTRPHRRRSAAARSPPPCSRGVSQAADGAKAAPEGTGLGQPSGGRVRGWWPRHFLPLLG
ncbi:hypothetical protein METEAL_00350 [Mesoterricola silvestris]|uniref:Uncharacterized protein n=1 Tax=Mesoterricola silvestris TaxID=2927979 RepID=A0AA48GSC9_9BACT|nr:hypothetical protein METEAL_00350 [Mesoterricola silvestris]